MRGLHRLVGVRLDPGRHAHERPLNAGFIRPVGLRERIHHEQRVLRRRKMQQLVLLVVPVDDEPVAGDAGTPRELELADRGDVGAEPLLAEQPKDGDRRERLRPVDDQRVRRGGAIRARLRAQRRLVVHHERRTEPARELRRRHAPEHEVRACDGGPVGKEPVKGRSHGWIAHVSMVTLTHMNLLLS